MRTKGSRKRISDEIREKVKILLAQGYSYNSISKELSISKDSIHRIGEEIDNLEQLRTDKKRKIAEKYWEKVILALGLVTKGKLKKLSAHQLMVSAAIGVDKALLLGGEVTERVGLTMEEIDRRLQDIKEKRKVLKQAQEVILKEGKRLKQDREEGSGGIPEN